MKINRHDQAKILLVQEIAWLFDGKVELVSDLKLFQLLVLLGKMQGMEAGASLLPKAIASLSLLSYIEGLPTERDRALFGICLYTTARVNEACSLHTADVYGTDGRVRDRITFRRATTKGKQETRSVPVSPELRELLTGYRSDHPYLFPGRWGRGHICPESADAILWAAFKRLGIEGASTHSFRRTAITWMHNERVPIKHIQSISGHKSLSALQRYIDVTEKDKEMAIVTLSFRS
ncbi:tyrosine-type recombinase/integrase [Leptolyngbya ohadii]|uniref:tyrosine-type recombinase/integrase n=1 Tax=Leptolyngbya ohadii TaxID=1962290 RepID=UPI001CEDC2B6|nr:site-specific integrase [Leptolyngbya ohadii]